MAVDQKAQLLILPKKILAYNIIMDAKFLKIKNTKIKRENLKNIQTHNYHYNNNFMNNIKIDQKLKFKKKFGWVPN